MTEDYEYRGLLAETWDLLRGDTSTWPDRPFYRAIIERQGGAALDVGCGAGRLILDYLDAGLDVDGIDNSPEMLALCRAKAAGLGIDLKDRLHLQEMDRLDLPRRYAVIFVPSLSFQLVLEPAAAETTMTRFRDHLAPGGVLVLSLKSRLWESRPTPRQMQWSPWFKLAERERDDGATVRRFIRTMYDHDQQVEHEENRYQILREGEVVDEEFHSRCPCVRWYSQEQALGLFARAGFTDIRMTAQESDRPASPDDNSFKIRGTRP
ncbi:MAG TPA: class I SAM-dependent methyltransferase [Caulobacteraceae bacterium]|nr:class I SAM-dependent methyltransferase [Caulobacteraceae bacterium]